MTLESTVWLSQDSEQSTYIVFDAATRRLANVMKVTFKGKEQYHPSQGAFYEITNETDPQTGNTRVRVFGERTDGWRDEYYRIEGDTLFWKTPIAEQFFQWKRVEIEALPTPVKAAAEKVFERMKDKA